MTYPQIQDAITQGINQKLFYLATGLSWEEFARKRRDESFSTHELYIIEQVVRKWNNENKFINRL